MENAAEALKMSAFVLIFVLALTIAIATLTQAKTTSEVILFAQDETNFYSYIEEDEFVSSGKYETSRKVGIDSIIPTLYRYNKEKFRVEFVGLDKELYRSRKTNEKMYSLDLDEEMVNEEEWQGSQKKTKENLDKIISSVLMRYKNRKFKEEVGTIESTTEAGNIQEKRVIRYTLL